MRTNRIKQDAATRVTRMSDTERSAIKLWLETEGSQGSSIGELFGFVEQPVREEMLRLIDRFVQR